MITRRKITVRKFILIIYDIVAPLFAFVISLMLYYNGMSQVPNYFKEPAKLICFGIAILSFISAYICGYWRYMWPYAGVDQYLVLVLGSLINTIGLGVFYYISGRLFFVPIGYYFNFFVINLGIVCFIRLFYRWYQHYCKKLELIKKFADKNSADKDLSSQTRVLIVGAGEAGRALVSDMNQLHTHRKAVAFVDDNIAKHNYLSMNIPVLGGRNKIPEIVRDYEIDEIIVAIPSLSQDKLKDLIQICKSTKVPVKMIPYWFANQVDDSNILSHVEAVKIEDLLGRPTVDLDLKAVSEFLTNKVILVTGGGGSIGSELSRQIASFSPKKLILFDIYENNVYDIQQELLRRYDKSFDLEVLIGSIRDRDRIEEIFSKYKPEVVFHAAAHKHVPLMEFSPADAIKNNIYGTYNVADIAGKYKVESFVLISTDKAVNPTNVMGATKRIAEMITLSMFQKYKDTRYTCVRFGNVLGSNGSVIPLFKRQINEDRVVTVTHPEMRRFFMTIPEAARLVLQAGSFAQGGQIFVLDMGEPMYIKDLAEELIRLSGLVPEKDVKIEYCGLRPGEKLVEELKLSNEAVSSTEHKKIFVVQQVRDQEKLLDEYDNSLKLLLKNHNPDLDSFVHNIISNIK